MPDLAYEIVNQDGSIKTVPLAEVIDIQKDMWTSGKVKVIGLVGLQKIATKENIVEKKFETHITPTADNKQQHVVNMWLGFRGNQDPDSWARGSGEASAYNTGKVLTDGKGGRRYEEYDYIDSRYRYAMADKRAFSRAMLKLINLYGVYSEVEARDFLKGKPTVTPSEVNAAGALQGEDYDY